MANASWPTGVPEYCLASAFKENKVKATRRFKPSAGPDIVWKRFTKVPTLYSMGIRMTQEQWAVLKEFRDVTLKQGTQLFDWVDPIDHVTPMECQFVGKLKVGEPDGGGNVVVTFNIMRMP